MPKTMNEIREHYRQIAQDYAEYLHSLQPAMGSGEAKAELLAVKPEEVIVVHFPADAPLHLIADIARFADSQRQAMGISVPVIVVPAESVTVENKPGG